MLISSNMKKIIDDKLTVLTFLVVITMYFAIKSVFRDGDNGLGIMPYLYLLPCFILILIEDLIFKKKEAKTLLLINYYTSVVLAIALTIWFGLKYSLTFHYAISIFLFFTGIVYVYFFSYLLLDTVSKKNSRQNRYVWRYNLLLVLLIGFIVPNIGWWLESSIVCAIFGTFGVIGTLCHRRIYCKMIILLNDDVSLK